MKGLRPMTVRKPCSFITWWELLAIVVGGRGGGGGEGELNIGGGGMTPISVTAIVDKSARRTMSQSYHQLLHELKS